jgi:hypothetical protein
VDVDALVDDALGEYKEIRKPNIVAQVKEFAEGSADEWFYLKSVPMLGPTDSTALAYADIALTSALKAGRRNSARDLELINRILQAAKELGASEDENTDAVADTAVKTFLLTSQLQLAELELAAL